MVFTDATNAGLLRLSIVLPTYNERGNIEALLQQLLGIKDRYDLELLVVDDDSADGTAELVRELAHRHPEIRLIRRVGRAGLASAIKEGLLDATGDLAVVMDSDGQHEPSAVLRALDTLQREGVDRGGQPLSQRRQHSGLERSS